MVVVTVKWRAISLELGRDTLITGFDRKGKMDEEKK